MPCHARPHISSTRYVPVEQYDRDTDSNSCNTLRVCLVQVCSCLATNTSFRYLLICCTVQGGYKHGSQNATTPSNKGESPKVFLWKVAASFPLPSNSHLLTLANKQQNCLYTVSTFPISHPVISSLYKVTE
jgi:hypothetical protein